MVSTTKNYDHCTQLWNFYINKINQVVQDKYSKSNITCDLEQVSE